VFLFTIHFFYDIIYYIRKESRYKMKEELIDVLDEHGIKTGQVLPRKEVHKQGL